MEINNRLENMLNFIHTKRENKTNLGIYQIRNVENNWRYIGQSIDILSRWKNHRSALLNNKHSNLLLQYDWNKYGEEVFIFEILEAVKEPKQLIAKENKWIKETGKYTFLYNSTIYPLIFLSEYKQAEC